ncbi:MAG: phenylalanine--tRNA ligase subunit beta [Thermoplasmatota archaeon]
MPVISVDSEELLKFTDAEEIDLLDALPKLGIEIEAIEDEEWELEVNPDRCDLLSVEGIGRAVKGFLGKETRLKRYDTKESDIKTEVELSVQDVRPYIVTALIKNIDLNEDILKSLMDLQEKLHLTLGRDREKVAIGVHDFAPIEPPFVYKAVRPDEVSFVPLEKHREMNLKEILERHDKGKEYAHILEDKERYPVILDSNDNVLSFPPVINGQLTQVTEDSDTLFIDMTGTDEKMLDYTLNILCTMFAERGADIYTTKVRYGSKEKVYPDLSTDKIEVDPSECSKLLGVELEDEDVLQLLEKMRFDGKIKDDKIEVEIPAYRHDILHPWDIVEDIAIGFDYDNFEGTLPEEVTIGKRLKDDKIKNSVTDLLVGYGFTEVMNYPLSNPEKEIGFLSEDGDDLSLVQNPVTEDKTCLRKWLLPSLLSNLRENRNKSLPQKIFEIGDVVVDDEQYTKTAGTVTHPEAGFSEMKSLMQGLLDNLDIDAIFESKKHEAFVEGRCAGVFLDEQEIGFYGEIHPEVLERFDLENPVIEFELDLEKIMDLKERL